MCLRRLGLWVCMAFSLDVACDVGHQAPVIEWWRKLER